ncbi:hypothetical protein BU16DRAFT_557442 [Lophium mytilinum]|uniref:Uncharacterized protein n=1 Tax=Lophium mytilinum TaxID=390894 RepID=A0A6A6R2V1_9PEZI|nr:hypothetical protein BU16DRAFT_557442 [Lophium mytilinum]
MHGSVLTLQLTPLLYSTYPCVFIARDLKAPSAFYYPPSSSTWASHPNEEVEGKLTNASFLHLSARSFTEPDSASWPSAPIFPIGTSHAFKSTWAVCLHFIIVFQTCTTVDPSIIRVKLQMRLGLDLALVIYPAEPRLKDLHTETEHLNTNLGGARTLYSSTFLTRRLTTSCLANHLSFDIRHQTLPSNAWPDAAHFERVVKQFVEPTWQKLVGAPYAVATSPCRDFSDAEYKTATGAERHRFAARRVLKVDGLFAGAGRGKSIGDLLTTDESKVILRYNACEAALKIMGPVVEEVFQDCAKVEAATMHAWPFLVFHFLST